ncbi:hypothetical protein ACFL6C_08005 [Myxococcota bacterium]
MDFSVESRLESEKLLCRILPSEAKDDDSFACYLVKDGKIIDKIYRYRTCNAFEWNLQDKGIYAAQGFLKRNDSIACKLSEPVAYFTEEDRRDLREFCQNSNREPIPRLPFFTSTYPHQDLALVFGPGKKHIDRSLLKSFAVGLQLEFSEVHLGGIKTCFLMSTRLMKGDGSYRYLFSGVGRNDSRLIFGDDDLANTDDANSLMDSVGDFLLIRISEDTVELATDYFGISKMYYYLDGDIFVVSSRYHLLLLLLNRLSIKPTLNVRKIIANLCSTSQPFQQNFSREMEMENSFVLPVDKKIRVSRNTVEFLDSEIHGLLRSPDAFDEHEYDALIGRAAVEITDNLKVALEHPAFDYARIDLSGGLDARLVFAALTNLPEYRRKIHIHTANMKTEPQDLPVSAALTNLYGYQYDTIPSFIEPTSKREVLADTISLHLGSYYLWGGLEQKAKMPKTIRIPGYFGEICARPYYARNLMDSDLDTNELHDFVKAYLAKAKRSAEVHIHKGPLAEILEQELARLPGRTPLEKFDLHYLYYRNGLHCTDRWLSNVVAPAWGPLQSKLLFRLKNMTFHTFKSIKLQLDITAALNPLIASLPYGRDKDNQDRLELEGDIRVSDPIFKHLNLVLDRDTSSWEESRQRKMANSVRTDDSERVRRGFVEDNELYSDFLYRSVMSALQFLLSYEGGRLMGESDVGLQIFSWIKNNDPSSTNVEMVTCLYNKVLNLYHQIQVFES